jgi:hypothetical protein
MTSGRRPAQQRGMRATCRPRVPVSWRSRSLRMGFCSSSAAGVSSRSAETTASKPIAIARPTGRSAMVGAAQTQERRYSRRCCALSTGAGVTSSSARAHHRARYAIGGAASPSSPATPFQAPSRFASRHATIVEAIVETAAAGSRRPAHRTPATPLPAPVLALPPAVACGRQRGALQSRSSSWSVDVRLRAEP